jgi:hypothetical protein
MRTLKEHLIFLKVINRRIAPLKIHTTRIMAPKHRGEAGDKEFS